MVVILAMLPWATHTANLTTSPQRIAAAKTGLSERTGRRIESDPRLPSQKAAERPRRRQVVDPLGGPWESDILPLLPVVPACGR